MESKIKFKRIPTWGIVRGEREGWSYRKEDGSDFLTIHFEVQKTPRVKLHLESMPGSSARFEVLDKLVEIFPMINVEAAREKFCKYKSVTLLILESKDQVEDLESVILKADEAIGDRIDEVMKSVELGKEWIRDTGEKKSSRVVTSVMKF